MVAEPMIRTISRGDCISKSRRSISELICACASFDLIILFVRDSLADKPPVPVACGLYLFFIFDIVIDPLGITPALPAERVADAVACSGCQTVSNDDE
jgi:ABC-type microcin C transport system permease subunit YejB